MQTPSSAPTDRPFGIWTSRFQRLVTQLHAWLYHHTGGKLGGRIVGAPVLLLMTTGRKTGKQRTTPLIYLTDGPNYVLVGSNGGVAKDPTWVFNLKAHPNATIQVGRRIFPVVAEQADESEKARLWPRLVELYGGYAGYQQRTSRPIPVVILRPAEQQ